MSSSEDINNLFTRFGSRSGRYHEIVRDEQTQDSIGRWPLLSHVDVNLVHDIPGVLAQPLARAAVQAVVAATPAGQATAAAALARFSAVRAEPAPIVTPVAPSVAVQEIPQVALSAAPTAQAANQQRSELRMVAPQAVAARPAAVARPLALAATLRGTHAAPLAVNAPVQALPLVDSATLGMPLPVAAARPVAERPEDTLRGLFGRLSAPVQPAAAPARPQPAFRRLRQS